eukprot:COSAG06_NODE_36843_length_440_cov_0.714286_2_plen_77_part_01
MAAAVAAAGKGKGTDKGVLEETLAAGKGVADAGAGADPKETGPPVPQRVQGNRLRTLQAERRRKHKRSALLKVRCLI